MRPSVVVVDYALCNIDSIARALDECGASVSVTRDPRVVEAADRLVLPGVGSFPRAMANLAEWGLVDAIRVRVADGAVPFLGICLGMQLMATKGTEHGACDGLGLLEATVTSLSPVQGERIPHMGWNEVEDCSSSSLFAGLAARPDFYFVHSYHLVPDDQAWVAGTTPYSGSFVSAIASPAAPIFGTQFHPEKSQKNGFRVLRNFLAS
ncbi:imidazole glycerol phosphate synthase subunit HisH [Alsobacter sp. R-9]